MQPDLHRSSPSAQASVCIIAREFAAPMIDERHRLSPSARAAKARRTGSRVLGSQSPLQSTSERANLCGNLGRPGLLIARS